MNFSIVKLINEAKEKHWWLEPLIIFIIWRVLMELIGRIALDQIDYLPQPWPHDPLPPLWARWDTGWYSSILTSGYHLREGIMSNVTFFPVYPLIWKIFWLMLPISRLAAGILTSNLITLIGCLVIYRWLKEVYSEKTARLSLIALLAWPASVSLVAAYSESVFILLTALTFWLAHKQKWFVASTMALLASATRPLGIVLWPTLFMLWRQRESNKKLTNAWPVVLLPPLGLIIFSLYLWQQTGDSLAWLNAQHLAGRSLAWPWPLLKAYWDNIIHLGNLWLLHLEELLVLIFALLLLPATTRLNKAFGIFTVFSLLPPLFTNTLTSFPRFVLVIIPIFIVIASIKQRWLYWIYLILCLPWLVWNIINFVTWQSAI